MNVKEVARFVRNSNRNRIVELEFVKSDNSVRKAFARIHKKSIKNNILKFYDMQLHDYRSANVTKIIKIDYAKNVKYAIMCSCKGFPFWLKEVVGFGIIKVTSFDNTILYDNYEKAKQEYLRCMINHNGNINEKIDIVEILQ